jgi:hypothetical protein
MQTQCRYRGVKFIDNRQGLDVGGLLKCAKEWLDTGKIRPWNKRTNEEVLLLAFDPHLADSPLLVIQQINNLLSILLHS